MILNTLPQAISPPAAYQLLQENPRAVLVDIRSTMEYLFVGHPCGCVHVPWIDEPDWVVNPHFNREIRKLILDAEQQPTQKHCATIILICRSGKRSLEAGQQLLAAGLNPVLHVDEGFEGDRDEHHHRGTLGGWRFHGLPWEQC
jgi:rhodanese-related sulfurtransferase